MTVKKEYDATERRTLSLQICQPSMRMVVIDAWWTDGESEEQPPIVAGSRVYPVLALQASITRVFEKRVPRSPRSRLVFC
jgi:hypothetical protein